MPLLVMEKLDQSLRGKLLVCCFCLLVSIMQAQLLTGKVISNEGKALSGVSIYLDGSQMQTLSNKAGLYKLDTQGFEGSIVFQKEGYRTAVFSVSALLQRKQPVELSTYHKIEEVVIIPYTRQAYQKFIGYFLETFLGVDSAGVKIKNPIALRFAYDKAQQVLTVKAVEPLEIVNRKLGYVIHYNLHRYQANFRKKMVSYFGTSYFIPTSIRKKIKMNRMEAYYGSLQHFVRSAYQGNLKEEGFEINYVKEMRNPEYPSEQELKDLKNYVNFMRGSDDYLTKMPKRIKDISSRKFKNPPYIFVVTRSRLSPDNFIKTEASHKFLTSNDILQVKYHKHFYDLKHGKIAPSKTYATVSSMLYLNGESFEIFPNGNTSDPEQLVSSGYFTQKKVKDLLPLDYRVGE